MAWLEITDQGRAVLDRVHGMRRADLELVLADWSAEERADLARLLDRFKRSMLDAPARRVVAS